MSVPTLAAMGWSPRLQAALDALGDARLVPARVFSESRGLLGVCDGTSELRVPLAGRLRHRTESRGDLPVVGDWVALAPGARGEATLQAVLPRRTKLARKVAGDRLDEQVLAANVDTTVLVMGLDRDFNPRRFERYLAMIAAGGPEAVVVLSKADLEPRAEARRQELQALAPAVPVATADLLQGDLPGAVTERAGAGQTLVFVGSSGAGKSTLVNRLAGRSVQRTGAVRASDNRGRHTTTSRQVFVLPSGALVIDTPGLREIHLHDPSAVDTAFDDIVALAAGCRFRDCRHVDEPNCAVRAALDAGALESSRLDSYRALRSGGAVSRRPPRRPSH